MFIRKQGFTLVEIMIVVAIIALLAAIAIPNLLRSRLNTAQTNAQATLRTISTAIESFAAASPQGLYPTEEQGVAALVNANPPYLHEDYTSGPYQGYEFSCEIDTASYTCTAVPTGAFSSGCHYQITSGGVWADPLCVGDEGHPETDPE